MARGSIFTRLLEDEKTKKYDTVIRVNGKQVWKTFSTKKAAQEHLNRFATDISDGTYREIRKATVTQYSEHWKKTHLTQHNIKATTLNSYLSVFDKWIKPEFEFRGMQSISSGDVNEFKAKLQNAGLQPKTVRNALNLLNKFFSDAVKDCYLRHSPMEGVDMPVISRKKKGRALKPNEVRALLDNCDDKQTELIVLMAVTTGMRRGELFGLFWEHVNWDDNAIHVKQALVWKYGKHIRPAEGELFAFTTPKSETSIRDIPMGQHLKKELRTLFLRSKKEGLVFHKEGRPLDPNGFAKRQFASAVMAADLGKVRFHDLRHSYGSHLLDHGCNIYDVQRWMGHSSIQVTIDVYGHPVTDRGQEAAAKTDAFLFGKTALAAD